MRVGSQMMPPPNGIWAIAHFQGDLNLATQIKLLRILQEREFERLGGTETIRTKKAIAAGEFREDLYYRVNVFAIFVPPLRERKPDVRRFVARARRSRKMRCKTR
jgi:transcriptional regulator with PAS, ATPase and Fis domain